METKQENNFNLLKMYGSRWAILTALRMDMAKRGLHLQTEEASILDVVRIEITSGCYSTCEIDCTLSKVEGQLISLGSALGEIYLDPWLDLLARSMQGKVDYEEILTIPALKPVETSCGFLKCSC